LLRVSLSLSLLLTLSLSSVEIPSSAGVRVPPRVQDLRTGRLSAVVDFRQLVRDCVHRDGGAPLTRLLGCQGRQSFLLSSVGVASSRTVYSCAQWQSLSVAYLVYSLLPPADLLCVWVCVCCVCVYFYFFYFFATHARDVEHQRTSAGRSPVVERNSAGRR
jgi:hypothetical protein